MTAAWAAVIVSIMGMLGALGVVLVRSGRHEGKLEAILDRLAEGQRDHEERLRRGGL